MEPERSRKKKEPQKGMIFFCRTEEPLRDLQDIGKDWNKREKNDNSNSNGGTQGAL